MFSFLLGRVCMMICVPCYNGILTLFDPKYTENGKIYKIYKQMFAFFKNLCYTFNKQMFEEENAI